MWSAYLGALVRFLRQPALQVESWGRGWRAPLQQAHGDLRVPAALHLLSMWSHLGNNFIDEKYSFNEKLLILVEINC